MDMRTAKQVKALGDFINELWAIPPEQFIMSDLDCGTAACIQGWFDRFYALRNIKIEFSEHHAAMMFGVNLSAWLDITHMYKLYEMARFDELVTPEDRKLAILNLLTQLLDSGDCSWTVALVETVGPEMTRLLDVNTPDEDKDLQELRRAVRRRPAQKDVVQRALSDRAFPDQEAQVLPEEAFA
jgi:hypothetical protein